MKEILSQKIGQSLEGKTHIYKGLSYVFTKGSIMLVPQLEDKPKYAGNFSVVGSDSSNIELHISSSSNPALIGTLKLRCEFVDENNIIPIVIN